MTQHLCRITVKDATLSSFVNGEIIIEGCITEVIPLASAMTEMVFNGATLTPLPACCESSEKPAVDSPDGEDKINTAG